MMWTMTPQRLIDEVQCLDEALAIGLITRREYERRVREAMERTPLPPLPGEES